MGMSYLKLFYDFKNEIEMLDMEERGRLLTAMLIYGGDGEDPTALMTGNERFLFPVCRQRIDRDAVAYEQKAEANRANGLKGGRPKKNPLGFSETEKSQDKDKDKDEDEDQDEVQDEEKDDMGVSPGRGAAAPSPTLKQVSAMGKMLAPSVDPERFWNHYQANGWRSNGAPIRDWKAMLRQWELENREGRAGPSTRAAQAANPALDYVQRDYKPEDYGDEYFLDLDEYAAK